MERLTEFKSEEWVIKKATWNNTPLLCGEQCERQRENPMFCKECPIQEAFDKLAAYENTGLTPKEVMQLKEKVEGL